MNEDNQNIPECMKNSSEWSTEPPIVDRLVEPDGLPVISDIVSIAYYQIRMAHERSKIGNDDTQMTDATIITELMKVLSRLERI